MGVLCGIRTNTECAATKNLKRLFKKRTAIARKPKIKTSPVEQHEKKAITAVNEKRNSVLRNKRKLEEVSECEKVIKRPKMDHCLGILAKLMKHKWSLPFRSPVDPNASGDYFQVIKRPVDLGTIKRMLQQNKYTSDGEFEADVRLTFANAMLYHPSTNWVHIYATKLDKLFDILWMPQKPKKTGEPIVKQTSTDKYDCSKTIEAEVVETIKGDCKLRNQREQERAAARASLDKMERSIVLDDNLKAQRDIEALIGRTKLFERPLQRLGLYIKQEFRLVDDYDDDELQRADMEEGEILV